MDNIIRFKQSNLNKITNFRLGEIKFGEKIHIVPKNEDLLNYIQNCEAKFVLLGIPEDIGVRSNFGRAGTYSAWESAVQNIVNLQHNKYCKGDSILLLGHINLEEEMNMANELDQSKPEDRKKLFKIVDQIDKEVSHIIFNIVKAGKIPIVIGGGHNNSYGNLKGTALAKGKPINAINFDAHTDFRNLEGRHSGNGFSYAFEEGFLKRYFIFGIHENYTSKSILDVIKKIDDKVKYNTYEEIKIKQHKSFSNELLLAYNFIKEDFYGLEIDLDAIPYTPSSAMTSSGFSVEELRQFVYFFSRHKNVCYFHICEGAPILGDEKNSHLTGRLIAFLTTDFIKGYLEINL